MESITNYFEGEKLQCIIGLVFSIICIAAAAYFLSLPKPLFKGIAYAFLLLSFFLLLICIGVIVRTPKDISRVATFYNEQPMKMQTEELPRMEKVMRSFSIIKKIEIVFFLVGIILVMLFWSNELVRGIAIGLVIQGVVLYLFDHVAESRGTIYLDFLKSLT